MHAWLFPFDDTAARNPIASLSPVIWYAPVDLEGPQVTGWRNRGLLGSEYDLNGTYGAASGPRVVEDDTIGVCIEGQTPGGVLTGLRTLSSTTIIPQPYTVGAVYRRHSLAPSSSMLFSSQVGALYASFTTGATPASNFSMVGGANVLVNPTSIDLGLTATYAVAEYNGAASRSVSTYSSIKSAVPNIGTLSIDGINLAASNVLGSISVDARIATLFVVLGTQLETVESALKRAWPQLS